MPGYTKCLVTRDRNGVKNRLYPTYQLFVQDGAPGTSPRLVMVRAPPPPLVPLPPPLDLCCPCPSW